MSTYAAFALGSLLDLLKGVILEPLITAPLLLGSFYIPHSVLPYAFNRTALATVFVSGLIRRLNNFLSDRVLNNWESDTYDWTKELVVVTGGSSGIGELVTQDLCRRGISVAIIDIVEPKFTIPQTARFFQCDLSKHDEITRACDSIRSTIRNPTILVNNAGVGSGKTILDTNHTEYHAIFDINTIAHFDLVKEFLPAMIENNHGHIITISSMASFITYACVVSYSQVKASALAFHEGLAQEIRHIYGAKKIRTSIFHPTWADTPMTKHFSTSEKWKEPTLKASQVADSIVQCILNGRSKQVVLPGVYAWTGMLKGWPNWIQEAVRDTGAAIIDAIRV